jgi:hypothetical protein
VLVERTPNRRVRDTARDPRSNSQFGETVDVVVYEVTSSVGRWSVDSPRYTRACTPPSSSKVATRASRIVPSLGRSCAGADSREFVGSLAAWARFQSRMDQPTDSVQDLVFQVSSCGPRPDCPTPGTDAFSAGN